LICLTYWNQSFVEEQKSRLLETGVLNTCFCRAPCFQYVRKSDLFTCKAGDIHIMNYFGIQLHDLKMLPVVFSLTAASRNEPVSGSVSYPFSSIPIWFCLPLQTDAIHFLGCTKKTFQYIYQNKMQFLYFLGWFPAWSSKPCTFLLKQLPILNGSTAQLYPVDYMTK